MAKKKIFIIFLRSSAVYERRKKSELATWHQRHPVGSLFGSGVYVCAERRVRAQRVPASAKREHTDERIFRYTRSHTFTHTHLSGEIGARWREERSKKKRALVRTHAHEDTIEANARTLWHTYFRRRTHTNERRRCSGCAVGGVRQFHRFLLWPTGGFFFTLLPSHRSAAAVWLRRLEGRTGGGSMAT